LNGGQNRQAVRVAVLVRIEGVHEDARIHGVPESFGGSSPTEPAPHASTRRHGSLSALAREEMHAAHAFAKSPFHTPTRAYERLPRGGRLVWSCGGVVAGLEGQNHADGPPAVSQDVRGPGLSHSPQDAGRMRFQFSDPDNLPRRSCLSAVVVPHVTTLRVTQSNGQGASIVRDRDRRLSGRRPRRPATLCLASHQRRDIPS
jgi:hypothetical protein